MAAANPTIEIDYTLAMRDGLGHDGGLLDAELDASVADFAAARERVSRRVREGELGFWELPSRRDATVAARHAADQLADLAEDVLVLGIGGSSLGARAVVDALGAAGCGVPADRCPRIHFPDNSDPWLLSLLLERLDPAKTGVVVVSKSGATIETTAQLHVVTRWLSTVLGAEDVRRRMVVVTDPRSGRLRELATRERWRALSIPPNVGGRFSVLSPAGLLPAALAGIDVDALLDGAAGMAERCGAAALRHNPAGVLALVHVLQHRLRSRAIHVMMPYADRLRAFSAWYVQLWAESLGKRTGFDGRVVESGPTPVSAIGATDQHAQLQLFVEGPRDKLVTFIAIDHIERDLVIPGGGADVPHLAQRTLGELLRAQREATSEALAADGRPSLTIHLERLDARAFGGLLFLYQAATAFAGALYGVDAFDQPGVELGKRFTDALMGREGTAETAARLCDLRSTRPTGYRV